MPKIKVQRVAEFIYAWRDFNIYINGLTYKIGNGQNIEIEVPSGTHTIRASVDWCDSNTLEVDVQDTQSKTIIVRNNARYQLSLIIILLPMAAFLFDSATDIFGKIGIVILLYGIQILLFRKVLPKKYLLLEQFEY